MDYNVSRFHPNQTDEEDHEDFIVGFLPSVDTLPVILAILIIVTNGLGILLFARNRRLRNITNTFLVSLAISDLTTGLFAIPFYLVCSTTQYMLCTTAKLCWRFTTTSTVLHLLMVTLDRYVAIVHAIRYHTIITRARAKAAIFTVWALAAFVTLIQLSWPTLQQIEEQQLSTEEEEEQETLYYKARNIYQLVMLFVFFAMPLVVIIYSYIRIFNIVRYHEKQIKRHSIPSGLANRKQSALDIPAQWKSALVFLVMTIVYVICWFPFFIYELRDMLFRVVIPHWVEYVFFYYPRFITSLTNPIFYIVGKHDFRKALCPKRNNENGTKMTSLISHGRSNSTGN